MYLLENACLVCYLQYNNILIRDNLSKLRNFFQGPINNLELKTKTFSSICELIESNWLRVFFFQKNFIAILDYKKLKFSFLQPWAYSGEIA